MIFSETPIPGVRLIELERHEDERGFFARTWCADEFAANGIEFEPAQCGTSFNRRRSTLRGLHFQAAPFGEAKLVRCTRGRMWDVVVDMRSRSPSCGMWWATELSADDGAMLFIEPGLAHGFQTLEDATEVLYQISPAFLPEAGRGVRWNDADLAIDWPIPEPAVMSGKDRALPRWRDVMRAGEAVEEAALPC